MERTARRRWWALAGILIGIGCSLGPQAGAQKPKPPTTAPNAVAKISAQTQNGQFQLEWDGKSGTFTRKATGNDPEIKLPLVYLQADPGPNGYAKHLAWFLARDKGQFALLWCYLDDSGRNFWCWLYRYPDNELLTVPFVGNYQFGLPPAGERPVLTDTFLSVPVPTYSGADFTYKDWTRTGGKLASLTLGNALPNGQALNLDPGKSIKSLTNLRVSPLHEIQVGQSNGWRPGGWNELHALAYDAANDPYYLILYSNTNIGYVVDLKRAQPYVADFGARVQFGPDNPAIGPTGKVDDAMITPRVVRYTRYEITFPLMRKPTHAYTEVNLDAVFHSPSGKTIRVPGFWDGDNLFRVRFVPTSVGNWSWHIDSNDDELNGKEGKLQCVAEHGAEKGYLQVTPLRSNQHHFVTGGTQPFYPVIAALPVSQDWYPAQTAGQQTRTAGWTPGKPGDPAAQFAAFQKRIDDLAAMGFNRLTGDFLLLPPSAHIIANNEGGEAFVGGDLDVLNPAFFQALDKRLTYCNAKGIVPDLGIGTDVAALYAKYDDLQLRRFWRYMLGRYATYDLCWNLFGNNWWENKVPPLTLDTRVSGLANLTRLYDPYNHPLTTLTRFVQTSTGAAAAPWSDVLEVPAYDTKVVDALYGFNRPIILVDTPALAAVAPPTEGAAETTKPPALPGDTGTKPASNSPDDIRHRLWETRMRGGYWTTAGPMDPQLLQWISYSGRFFQKTRYWRMEPHQEMLGGPEETPAQKRRREMAEEQAHKKNPNAPPTSDTPNAVPAGPIFVLADPAHEYAVYFEKGGSVTLDLLEATGRIKVMWFNPRTGESLEEAGKFGGNYQTFIAPDSNDWVLYVARTAAPR